MRLGIWLKITGFFYQKGSQVFIDEKFSCRHLPCSLCHDRIGCSKTVVIRAHYYDIIGDLGCGKYRTGHTA
jgi:hypothetical protein